MAGPSYTIELTDAEAVTVERIAAHRGLTAEQVVQHLVRTHLFRVIVALATEGWTFQDVVTGVVGVDWKAIDAQFEEFSSLLMEDAPEGPTRQ